MDYLKRTWADISLDNLNHNYQQLRAKIPSGCRLLGVVKADAYGHGAVPISRHLCELGAEFLAVSNLEEAMQLRRGGIRRPILILGYTPPAYARDLVAMGLRQEVHSLEYARALHERRKGSERRLKVHIKLDTGMNRIGVHYTQVLDFVRGINFHRGIQCDGVFTHFATADEPSGWDYKLQCQRFTEAVQAIKDAGFECGIVHCANTSSSMLDPSMHFDMIRAGVGLYGMQPCELSGRVMQLDPVMSVHARVTRVAHPAMGEGVGYGFTYRVPRTRVQICTLPIGYADGLSRTLSNRMDVLYRGERVHQVGNICMDQFMVAIQSNPAHEIPEAEYGDEMIIVGRDGDAEITMDEMARLRGTINYEVACGFGMRLDKVYV